MKLTGSQFSGDGPEKSSSMVMMSPSKSRPGIEKSGCSAVPSVVCFCVVCGFAGLPVCVSDFDAVPSFTEASVFTAWVLPDAPAASAQVSAALTSNVMARTIATVLAPLRPVRCLFITVLQGLFYCVLKSNNNAAYQFWPEGPNGTHQPYHIPGYQIFEYPL